MLIPFSYIKKLHLQILKNQAQFFAHPLFQILEKEYLQISKNTYKSLFLLIILKETIYIKTIIQTILIKTIIEIDKHKTKYIITACIPVIIIKNVLLFFFTIYKNERKEHKF